MTFHTSSVLAQRTTCWSGLTMLMATSQRSWSPSTSSKSARRPANFRCLSFERSSTIIHGGSTASRRKAMRFGTFNYAQWRPDVSEPRAYGELIEQMLLTERLGFAEAWFAEHHHSDYGMLA